MPQTTITLPTIESIFGDLPTLETERLVLRKMRMEDASDLFAYAADPEVSTYTLWTPHRSIDESRAFLRYIIGNYVRGEIENWGIVLKENNRFIGTCGYFYWNQEHCRAEIQYALSRQYWNKGIMSEAVRRIIQFGFERMALNRIEAKCMVKNNGSERVMQKCGMSCEGILREEIFAKGSFHDLKVYSILRREWKPI